MSGPKKIMMLLWLCLFSTAIKAHVQIESYYTLRYLENQGWTVYFETPTSTLSKSIQNLYPDLKGTDLNSTQFKQASIQFFEKNILLENNRRSYRLWKSEVNFNGIKTDGYFVLKNMPQEFENMSVELLCFTKSKKHIANSLSIILDSEVYKITLTETDTKTVFNNNTKSFNAKVIEELNFNGLYYALSSIIPLVLITKLYLNKKNNSFQKHE